MSELNLPICPRTKELHDWKIFLEDGGLEIRCDYCGEKHWDDEAIERLHDYLEALSDAREEIERLENKLYAINIFQQMKDENDELKAELERLRGEG